MQRRVETVTLRRILRPNNRPARYLLILGTGAPTWVTCIYPFSLINFHRIPMLPSRRTVTSQFLHRPLHHPFMGRGWYPRDRRQVANSSNEIHSPFLIPCSQCLVERMGEGAAIWSLGRDEEQVCQGSPFHKLRIHYPSRIFCLSIYN